MTCEIIKFKYSFYAFSHSKLTKKSANLQKGKNRRRLQLLDSSSDEELKKDDVVVDAKSVCNSASQPYSKEEEQRIVDYIISSNSYDQLSNSSSNELWKTIASEKQIFGNVRPWLSVKKHFCKQVYPNIESYKNVSIKIANNFKRSFMGLTVAESGEISSNEESNCSIRNKAEECSLNKNVENKEIANLSNECTKAALSSNFDLELQFGDDDFIFENYDDNPTAVEEVRNAMKNTKSMVVTDALPNESGKMQQEEQAPDIPDNPKEEDFVEEDFDYEGCVEYERDYTPPPDDILDEHLDGAGDSNHSITDSKPKVVDAALKQACRGKNAYNLTGTISETYLQPLETLRAQLIFLLDSSNQTNGLKTAADARQLVLLQNRALITLAQFYGKILTDNVTPVPPILAQLSNVIDQVQLKVEGTLSPRKRAPDTQATSTKPTTSQVTVGSVAKNNAQVALETNQKLAQKF